MASWFRRAPSKKEEARESEGEDDAPRGTQPQKWLNLNLGGKPVTLGGNPNQIKPVKPARRTGAPPELRAEAPIINKPEPPPPIPRKPPSAKSAPPVASSPERINASPVVSEPPPGKKRLASGSALYLHNDEPTPSQLAEVEEEAVEDRRRLRMALFWILVCAIAMGAYAMYAMEKIKKNIKNTHDQKMREVASLFPKNPYEYNERQRKVYAKNFWRRFNFRNLFLLGVSIMAALLVARWHRIRRVQIHRRKTIFFWMWTFLAGFMAVCWSVYIAKRAQDPIIVKQIKRNPYLRAFLYVGSILLVSLLFYAYKLKNRKSKKQLFLEKWRARKHEAWANKAKDVRYQDLKPMKMDPLKPGGAGAAKPGPALPKSPSDLAYKPS